MIRMEAACFLVMVLIYLYPSLRCEYDIDPDLGGWKYRILFCSHW